MIIESQRLLIRIPMAFMFFVIQNSLVDFICFSFIHYHMKINLFVK